MKIQSTDGTRSPPGATRSHRDSNDEMFRSSAKTSKTSPLYKKSHALWDHTVLPAIQQKWLLAFTPAVLDLTTPEG